jgi:hypothetical protein
MLRIESARRRAPVPLFFACPKKRRQKKGPPTTCAATATRPSLRFSQFPVRVNSLAALAQTCTRIFPEPAAMLGSVNGIGAACPARVRLVNPTQVKRQNAFRHSLQSV